MVFYCHCFYLHLGSLELNFGKRVSVYIVHIRRSPQRILLHGYNRDVVDNFVEVEGLDLKVRVQMFDHVPHSSLFIRGGHITCIRIHVQPLNDKNLVAYNHKPSLSQLLYDTSCLALFPGPRPASHRFTILQVTGSWAGA